MKSSLFIVLSVVVFAGCATSKPIQGPNGKQAFYIKCGAAAMDACYEEAAKVCPKGYAFLDKGSNPQGIIVPVGNALMVGHGPNTMLIECKD